MEIAADDDFLLPMNRAAAMSYLLTLTAAGYHYWNAGSVHHEKAAGFLKKMRALYPVDLTPGQRAVAQAKGRANVTLVMYPDATRTGYLQWFLLATRGRHPVDPVTGEVLTHQPFVDCIHQREKMKDCCKLPLTWLGHYQLVQHQPTRDPRKRKSQKRVWTWRLSPDSFRQWQVRLDQAAKVSNAALRKEISPLLRAPMFSGVREDVAALAASAESAFRKQHKAASFISPLPTVLPYMPKVKVFHSATLYAAVVQLQQEALEAKERAMAATRAVLAGAEPPMKFTQSLFTKEKSDGFVAQEDGDRAL